MLPSGWANQKISDLLERVVHPVAVDLSKTYEQIGIRSHGKGIFYKEMVTGESLGSKRVFWVQPNCFVVNIVFAWEQAVALTTNGDVGKIASHRFPMYRPKNGASDIGFLSYFFKTKRGKHLLGLASPGGAGRNKTLGQKEFDRLTLCVPPASEQNKIAQILSTWDLAIEIIGKLIENSKAQKKALMQKLLTGEKRLKKIEGRDWTNAKIGDLFDITAGKSKRDYLKERGDFVVIDMGAVSRDGELLERKYANISVDLLQKEDLIMPKDDIGGGNIIGKVALIRKNDKYILGDHVYRLRPISQICSEYFSYAINQFGINKNLRRMANGTAQLGLNKKDIIKQIILLPPLDEQIAITRSLSNADKEIKTLQRQHDLLITEKNALMQQLLTGKRRVQVDEAP